MSISRFYLSLLLCLAGQLAFPGHVARADTAEIEAGQTVILTATADGTEPFTYQWFKNGLALMGATDSIYVLEGFKAADAGNYSARVANYLGSTMSDLGTVIFVAAPVFTTQPASQSVVLGHAVTFTAAASGPPAPAYQWRKNGVAISGATASTYTIASVTTASAATYSVVATNSVGTATSTGAVLTVTIPAVAPVFTTQPASKSVVLGHAVTFTAAASGTPTPTYQWRKNGVAISGATAGTYTIASVTTASAATYSVVATNSVGTATSTGAVLTVTIPAVAPVFTTQPIGQTVVAGSAVTFTAAASGTPVPTYQWRKDGATISGATGSTYTIASATMANAGIYSVTAANSAGTVASVGAVLIVTLPTPPVFTTQPASATKTAGSAITFTAAAIGSPPPTYQWLKNGLAIAGATGSTYTIASVAAAHAGSYSVVATNPAGAIRSMEAVLTVYFPPPVAADFDSDGKSDVLLENILTGQHSLWLMAGTSITSTVTLDLLATSWEVVAVGEFNGDGKTDVLWQNLVTRECSVWLMAGTAVASTVSLGVPAAGMQMVGAGDFNADGKTDILWLNTGTGQYSLRLMNGTTPGASIPLGTLNAEWSVAGTGDFNGDGKTDILWERAKDGRCGLWPMNGSVCVGWADLPTMYGWQVGGTGDFNGDGKIDILWQNTATGVCKVALMSGLAKLGEVTLGTVPAGWLMAD